MIHLLNNMGKKKGFKKLQIQIVELYGAKDGNETIKSDPVNFSYNDTSNTFECAAADVIRQELNHQYRVDMLSRK